MTRDVVSEMLAKIAGCFNVKMHPASLDGWFNALRSVSDTSGQRALNRYIETESKIPRPADILRMARDVANEIVPEHDPEELLASLNRRASARAAERLRLRDEAEVRFQLHMANRRHAAGALRDSDHAYFRRVIGPDWIEKAGLSGVKEIAGAVEIGSVRGERPELMKSDPMDGIAKRMTPAAINRYGMVCSRPADWRFSFEAGTEIPPCVACYADRTVTNCDVPQLRECGREMMKSPMRSMPEVPGFVDEVVGAKE